MSTVSVRQAAVADVDRLAPLFDAYRRFYEQPADVGLAGRYLKERLERGESVVFIAEHEASAAGFCQLYPGWCSVAAASTFVLYDLFVAEESRRLGVGRRLVSAAQEYARGTGAARLDLSTARSNLRAQALYESLGWRRDDVFLTYSLPLEAPPAGER